MDNTDETASAATLGDTAESRGTAVTKGQKRSLASAGKKERQSYVRLSVRSLYQYS